MIKSIPDSGTLGYLLQIIRYLCRFLPKRHSFVNIDILISKYYQIVGLCLDFFNQLLNSHAILADLNLNILRASFFCH